MPIERHPIKDRKQWLALRKQDVTASDLGALFGLTPWKSALQLYAEKAGIAPEQGETPVMRRGRRDEPSIVCALREERPNWTLKYPVGLYFRDAECRFGSTPDVLASDPERGEGVVQCKSVAYDVWLKSWCGGDADAPPDVPLPYLLQTLGDAHLTEAKWAALAVHVRTAWTEDLKIIPIERDERAEGNIRDAIDRFWKMVAAGKAPPADYKLDAKVIEWLHPKDSGAELDLSANNEAPALVAEYVHLRAHLKECEERKTEIGTQLKELLGDASAARLADGSKISWKIMNRPEHLVEEWSGRVLRVTPAKAKKEKANAEGN